LPWACRWKFTFLAQSNKN